MSFLDIFALFILLVLAAFFVAVWVVLGVLPGRIARSRNHPHADAITICGWVGACTMGLFAPLAFIWAYYDPLWREKAEKTTSAEIGNGEDTTNKEASK